MAANSRGERPSSSYRKGGRAWSLPAFVRVAWEPNPPIGSTHLEQGRHGPQKQAWSSCLPVSACLIAAQLSVSARNATFVLLKCLYHARRRCICLRCTLAPLRLMAPCSPCGPYPCGSRPCGPCPCNPEAHLSLLLQQQPFIYMHSGVVLALGP